MPYILMLNDMRMPNVENCEYVLWASTREAIIDFMNEELAEEGYIDKGLYRKEPVKSSSHRPPWTPESAMTGFFQKYRLYRR